MCFQAWTSSEQARSKTYRPLRQLPTVTARDLLDRALRRSDLFCVCSGTNIFIITQPWGRLVHLQLGSARIGQTSVQCLWPQDCFNGWVSSRLLLSERYMYTVSCLKLVSEQVLAGSLQFCNCWGQSRLCRIDSHSDGTRNGRRRFRLEIRNTCTFLMKQTSNTCLGFAAVVLALCAATNAVSQPEWIEQLQHQATGAIYSAQNGANTSLLIQGYYIDPFLQDEALAIPAAVLVAQSESTHPWSSLHVSEHDPELQQLSLTS